MTYSEEQIIALCNTQSVVPPHTLTKGIGDDCAMFSLAAERDTWLISTDSFVEHVHFRQDYADLSQIGYKAVIVNLSDVYAKGVRPSFILCNLSLPNSLTNSQTELLLSGIKQAAFDHKVTIIGGDTTLSPRDIFINIVVLGHAPQAHIKYRDTFQIGDIICLTDYIGLSRLGLYCLEQGQLLEHKLLINAHLTPHIAHDTGPWLGEEASVSAMMDISDGLFLDLHKLCAANPQKYGASIDVAKLPLHQELMACAAQYQLNYLEEMILGGEDYTLLCLIKPDYFEDISQRFQQTFKKPLYPIGHITEPNTPVQFCDNGKSMVFHQKPFHHFNQSA